MTLQTIRFSRLPHFFSSFFFLVVISALFIISCTDSPVTQSKNTAPRWGSADSLRITLTKDSTYSLKLSDTCSDLQNDTISFLVTSLFPSSDTIIGSVYSMNASTCVTGTFTVSIVASDPSGLSDTLYIKFSIIEIQPIALSQDTLKAWLLTKPPFDFVLIDIRGPQDFLVHPYIIGSNLCKPYNLSWPSIFQEYCKGFSKDQHIVIYCKSGVRAALASTHIASLGYRNT